MLINEPAGDNDKTMVNLKRKNELPNWGLSPKRYMTDSVRSNQLIRANPLNCKLSQHCTFGFRSIKLC